MAVLDHGIIHFKDRQEVVVRVVVLPVTTQAIVAEMAQEPRARAMLEPLEMGRMFQVVVVVQAVLVQLVDLMGRQSVDPVCKIAF
jgi:hypothetical protein